LLPLRATKEAHRKRGDSVGEVDAATTWAASMPVFASVIVAGVLEIVVVVVAAAAAAVAAAAAAVGGGQLNSTAVVVAVVERRQQAEGAGAVEQLVANGAVVAAAEELSEEGVESCSRDDHRIFCHAPARDPSLASKKIEKYEQAGEKMQRGVGVRALKGRSAKKLRPSSHPH